MKNLILAVILSLASMIASAASVTDAINGAGSLVFSGSVYVDNNVGSGQGARGIAKVTGISNSDGSIIWNDSNSELNIVFSGFDRNITSAGAVSQFESTVGSVEFWESTTGTFQSTGGWLLDSAAIRTGTQQLLARGQSDSNGAAVYGQFASTFYSSNGFLSVDSGNWFDMLNTNSIEDIVTASVFADMTFNISADRYADSKYTYSGSGDLATLSIAQNVSEPDALALMGLGLVGIGFVIRRNT